MKDYLDVYLMNDQPATCPQCGSRSDLTYEVPNSPYCRQYHRCLNQKCQFQFVLEVDLEMYEEWSNPLD